MTEDTQSEPDRRSLVNLLLICLLSIVLMAIPPFFESKTQNTEAVPVQPSFYIKDGYNPTLLSSLQENTLLAISETFWQEQEPEEPLVQKIEVIVTGYSSTVEQTDDTPFITAAGTSVRNGIVAANFLPFGTKIKIPEVYADEVFVVEDRMHPRNNRNVDIWFPTYWQALNFGARRTHIEIIEG